MSIYMNCVTASLYFGIKSSELLYTNLQGNTFCPSNCRTKYEFPSRYMKVLAMSFVRVANGSHR